MVRLVDDEPTVGSYGGREAMLYTRVNDVCVSMSDGHVFDIRRGWYR